MIRIVCTSCQKPLSLDETKLPMKEVSFPCPVCKTKLMVDRRNLPGADAPPQSAPAILAVGAEGHRAAHPIVIARGPIKQIGDKTGPLRRRGIKRGERSVRDQLRRRFDLLLRGDHRCGVTRRTGTISASG